QVVRGRTERPVERDNRGRVRSFEIDPGERASLPQHNPAVLEPGLEAWTLGNGAHTRIGLSLFGSEEKRHAGSSRRVQSGESGSAAQPQGRAEKRVRRHQFVLELLSAPNADFFTDAARFAAC